MRKRTKIVLVVILLLAAMAGLYYCFLAPPATPERCRAQAWLAEDSRKGFLGKFLPWFEDGVRHAPEACLRSDLQTIRSQIELYKVQHLDALPGVTPDGKFNDRLFIKQLTQFTDQTGEVGDGETRTEPFPFGPYILAIPTNPFAPFEVEGKVLAGQGPPPRDDSSGWWLDLKTGTFHTNDSFHQGQAAP